MLITLAPPGNPPGKAWLTKSTLNILDGWPKPAVPRARLQAVQDAFTVRRFVLAWLAAIAGAATGATLTQTVLAQVGGGRVVVDSVVVVLIFSLAYSAIGATALGPPTLLLLLRLRLHTTMAFGAAGGLVGLIATAAVIHYGDYSWDDLFVEMGTAAGLCGALAFHRVWFRGSRPP